MWKLGLWMSIESDDDVDSRDDSMEQEDATPGENQGIVSGLMEADLKPSEHLYAEQITMAEYQKQSEEYTKQCLQQLLNSEEYQRIYKTCSSCNACWYDEQASPGCAECGDGGYAIRRPCAICCGKCQQIWTRDIDMSHKMKEAHWNGKCGLPYQEQQVFILENLIDGDEDMLTDAMQDL